MSFSDEQAAAITLTSLHDQAVTPEAQDRKVKRRDTNHRRINKKLKFELKDVKKHEDTMWTTYTSNNMTVSVPVYKHDTMQDFKERCTETARKALLPPSETIFATFHGQTVRVNLNEWTMLTAGRYVNGEHILTNQSCNKCLNCASGKTCGQAWFEMKKRVGSK